LHKKLSPYLLRRQKHEVEKSVPLKEETIIEVELTVSQKQYYRAIYEQNVDFLYKDGYKNGPRLTNLAMELRKCCNHPFLVKGAEAEIAQNLFIASSASEDGGASFNSDENIVNCCGKLVLLDKLLPKLKSSGSRVLIFSQFVIMLDILQDYLVLRGYKFARVDGRITGKARQHEIDQYSAVDSELFVMLLSTKAGGVGINLASADTVVIYDSDWNPQVRGIMYLVGLCNIC
jgi:SNF2 family DNA or RNA helicase